MGSSNPTAERRLEIGLALLADGAADEAASAFEAALELDPGYADAHFSLGQALEQLGQNGRAAESYRRYLAADPGDRMGASVRLAILGAAPTPERLPEAYVRTLFDQYAPRFDESLTHRLGYRAPGLLRQAVDAVRGSDAQPVSVLDLGCGTGLAGEAFRNTASWLEGVDLSPAMVAKARARKIYDALAVAELTAALGRTDRRYDLIVAADVLVYLGELGGLFAAVRRCLNPRGLFAFTLESTDEPGYVLRDRNRYAHNELYVAAQAAVAGMELAALSRDWSRTEAGLPVDGLVVVLRCHGEDRMADVVAGTHAPRGRGRLDA